MTGNYLRERMAAYEQTGEPNPEQLRRSALNTANKKARARFYAAELALDAAQRECTQAITGKAPDEWGEALAAYEAGISGLVAAAEMLPPSTKESK